MLPAPPAPRVTLAPVAPGTPAPAAPDPPGGDLPSSQPSTLVLEAEHGQVRAPLLRFQDPAASGGTYVAVAEEADDPAEGGVDLSWRMAQEGDMVIWARVRAPNTGSNSFFVRLDGGQRYVWKTRGPDGRASMPTWAWTRLPAADGTLVHRLAPGWHELRLYGRETGTRLDAVAIAPASAPPPG